MIDIIVCIYETKKKLWKNKIGRTKEMKVKNKKKDLKKNTNFLKYIIIIYHHLKMCYECSMKAYVLA